MKLFRIAACVLALQACTLANPRVEDLRGLPDSASVEYTVTAGRLTLVFSEDAAITIVDSGAFFSAVLGNGFDRSGNTLIRAGEGKALHITLTLRGGSVTLLPADSTMPLDSVLAHASAPTLASAQFINNWSDFVRYNRAEGLFLGAAFDSRRLDRGRRGLLLSAGYATGARLVEYEAGAVVGFPLGRIKAEGRLTHGLRAITEDTRIIDADENTLLMFLFGDDYRDYFNSKYTELSGSLQPLRGFRLFGAAGNAYYHSLARNAVFHLFGDDSLFVRWNPGVIENEDHYLKAGAEWDDVRGPFPRQGFRAKALGEYSGGRIKSSFSYRKATLDLRAFRPLSPVVELSCGLFAGEVTGKVGRNAIATQKLFDFGGIGTVRGLRFREEADFLDQDRIVTATAEIRVRAGRILDGFIPVLPRLLPPRSLILVGFDAGSIWNTQNDNLDFDNLFTEMRMARFHKSVTLGLSDPNENIRLELSRAFRFDRDETSDAVMLRITPKRF
ncbi:MAG: BamA/TamA family outer membrane protein [Fibrobacterota bacterium]